MPRPSCSPTISSSLATPSSNRPSTVSSSPRRPTWPSASWPGTASSRPPTAPWPRSRRARRRPRSGMPRRAFGRCASSPLTTGCSCSRRNGRASPPSWVTPSGRGRRWRRSPTSLGSKPRCSSSRPTRRASSRAWPPGCRSKAVRAAISRRPSYAWILWRSRVTGSHRSSTSRRCWPWRSRIRRS